MLALFFGIRGIGTLFQVFDPRLEADIAYKIVSAGVVLLQFAFAWFMWAISPRFYNPRATETRNSGISPPELFKVLLAAMGAYFVLVSTPQLIGVLLGGGIDTEAFVRFTGRPYKVDLIENVVRLLAGIVLLLFNIPLGTKPEEAEP